MTGRERRSTLLRVYAIVAGMILFATAAGLWIIATRVPVMATPSHAAAYPEHLHRPEWLTVAPSQVKEAYAWAATNHEALQYIPCYCGCDQAHTSNSDCFYDRDAQGNIVDYDSHALACHTCIDIIQDVQRSIEKGKSLGQIRREIDAKYEGIGAPPTPTPLPPSV